MTPVPYDISDLSLVFFAKSRPWTVPASHKAFGEIKAILQGDPAAIDIDHITALADPREPIVKASSGLLRFEGNTMIYGEQTLHNAWVDKILKFRDAGEVFDPIFLALEDLQSNPTQAARERLPVFVERSRLGFFPDGRIAAFKGVRDDFYDVHSGTVLYAPGTTVSMPREACNANPDQTCTAGLHLGAIDYIKNLGYSWGANRRMLLCAFWPRHVVAVPTDYQGGKMRVEQMDVIEEVDRDYVDRLLNDGELIVRRASTVTGPKENPQNPLPAFQQAREGDWIIVSNDSSLSDGEYLVVGVRADNEELRVSVKTGSSDDDVEQVDNDAVQEILDEAPVWFRAKVGDWMRVGSIFGVVTAVDDEEFNPYTGARLSIDPGDGAEGFDNDSDFELLSEPPAVWVRVREEDKVRIEGHEFLRDGEYEVAGFSDRDLYEPSDKRILINVSDNDFEIRNDLIKFIVREEEQAASQPALALEVPGTTPAEPAWKTAKVGDTITIKGSGRFNDGNYVVEQVDDGNGMDRRLKVINYGGPKWVDNDKVVAIVASTAPVTDSREIWEQVLAGDEIRIVNDPDVGDGTYTVARTDHSLMNGPDGTGIRLVDHGWIYNKTVQEIVTRDGKPFAASTTVAIDRRPIWEQVLKGDLVRIEGSQKVPNGSYKVYQTDEALKRGAAALGVNLDSGHWIYNRDVKAILERNGKPFGQAAAA